MQFRLAMAALFLFVLAVRGQGQAKKWTEYKSTEGGFTVLFPEKPSTQSTKQMVGDRERTVHVIAVQRKKDDQHGYVVTFLDWGQEPQTERERKEFLRGVQSGVLSLTKSKLLDQKEVTFGKHDGLEFRAESSQGFLMRYRLFMVGARLIALGFLGKDKAALDPTEAEKFLDSFKTTQ